MASAFGHGFAGYMLGQIAYDRQMPAKFWILSILCGILPDIDALGYFLGVPYHSALGHRGFTHSIVFALLVGVFIPLVFFSEVQRFTPYWWGLAAFFFLATISHSLLDGLTTGGLGAAYFAPFDNTRYFLPWRPIKVSPIGISAFFSEWGRRVIISEAIWIGIPLTAAWVIKFIAKKLT
jgi:inner membrane protein